MPGFPKRAFARLGLVYRKHIMGCRMKKLVILACAVLLLVAVSFFPATAVSGDAASMPASQPSATSSSKPSVPDATVLKESRKLVSEVYGDDFVTAKTKDQKAALAKKLLQAALDTKTDDAGRYVLLDTACDLAIQAEDAETTFSVAEQIMSCFQVDGLKLNTEALSRLAKAKGIDQRFLVNKANTLIDDAVVADRYDVAKQLIDIALAAAKNTKDLDFIKVVGVRGQEVRSAESAYLAAKTAMATLARAPKDPEANLVAGRFFAFAKGDWARGLQMFMLSSDAALKKLADMEVARPTDADKQVQLADGWWTIAEKETGHVKEQVMKHAGEWYEKTLPHLTGLVKAKVEKRLKELSRAGKSEIDLLAMVNTDHDTLAGTCKREGGKITISDAGRLRIPFSPKGDYELTIHAMRIFGSNDIMVYFPVGDTMTTLIISGWYGSGSGLELVEGHSWVGNKTSVKPGKLVNNKWYNIKVKVAGDGDTAEITIQMDGKDYIHWKGKESELSALDDIPKEVLRRQMVVLGASHDAVNVFDSVKLTKLGRRAARTETRSAVGKP